MAITRIAHSSRPNAGKYASLVAQARRLGRVRSLAWRLYGSLSGVGLSDRRIRDQWMVDGTAEKFGVLANAWKETLRDAVADIRAHREAAKVEVRRSIQQRRAMPDEERKRLYTLLKHDRWTGDPLLRRLMRRHWKHGHNHTHNQIIIRSDKVHTFTLSEGGDVWLAVPGLERRATVAVPLNTTIAPTGTLRRLLRGGRVEVHYQSDDRALKSAHRPAGGRTIGVDKGYSEVLTDSDGERHGVELGGLLRTRSDVLNARYARRAKLRAIAARAVRRGQHRKAERVLRNNLGVVKKHRQQGRWKQQVRTVTFRAVNAVVDKASVVTAEDLTKGFSPRSRGATANRRLAAWTKGVTAEALKNVPHRRGSAVRLVNAAYTSQVIPGTSSFGKRSGDRLHCTSCGVVWDADHAAAINILDRAADPDIGLYTPHQRVKQIIQERGRQRSRLPDQDSNTVGNCRCGERNIQSRSPLITE
jgi:hypothetical protein